MLKRAHQRLQRALPGLQRLLGYLRQRAEHTAERTAERTADTRCHLRDHLGHSVGAHALELLGGIGLIRRELRRGIGRVGSAIGIIGGDLAVYGSQIGVGGHAKSRHRSINR